MASSFGCRLTARWESALEGLPLQTRRCTCGFPSPIPLGLGFLSRKRTIYLLPPKISPPPVWALGLTVSGLVRMGSGTEPLFLSGLGTGGRTGGV